MRRRSRVAAQEAPAAAYARGYVAGQAASVIPTLTGGGAVRSAPQTETITSDVTVSFALSKPSGSSASLSSASGTSTSFMEDLPGYYEVTATVSGGGSAKTGIALSLGAPDALLSPVDISPELAGSPEGQLSTPAGVLSPSWSA